MRARLWRDKLPHLLLAGFGIAFAAVLLWVLDVRAAAIGFLCLVLALCVLLPLVWECARKGAFYADALGKLEGLEEKYLLCELLEKPTFAEGAFYRETTRALGRAMTGRVADARRDMADYREYIEGWVHEAKTPIAAARLALENLPGPPSAPLDEALFRLELCVDQALFYARSGAVEKDYLIRPLALREVCAAAVKKYARPLIAAGFRIRLEGVDATCRSDAKWVEFILGQLISNAIKYRGEAPALTFTQTVAENAVSLHVHDNGVGLSAADLPRVFEKGFTGENGRSGAAKSTGLGLYLTQKLCHRLGLGIALDRAEDGGTTATLIFPKSRFHLAE